MILPVLFLTFTGSTLADPPASVTDAHGCNAQQAEVFLRGRLGLWQPRLNLADWKISIVMSHAGDLKPTTLGNIHWDEHKKTAAIRVLEASEYQLSCRAALADMEATLVHELVHLELCSLPRSQDSRHEEELAVNRIADALLRLDRQTAAVPALADGEGRAVAHDSKPDASRSRADAAAPAW